jgi:hypothetical protein
MVDAGPSVLGASGDSGRASRQKMPKIATSKSVCARNRRGLTDTGRYSLWHIAGVQVRAFGGPYSGRLRRLRRRTESWLTLTMYERRTHPSGQAVCLLGLRRGRFWGGVAGLALLICAAGALSTYAGATLALAVVGLLLPRSVGASRALGHRGQLGRLTPPGRYVYVHSVASSLPGAGAELLQRLAHEADVKGWSLVLDAGNEKLVGYYARFGFVARGPAVTMHDGSGRVRMWRPATAAGPGHYEDQ